MEKKARLEENEEKRRFWEAHLKRWETSGITQNEYCREKQPESEPLYLLEEEVSAKVHRLPGGVVSAEGGEELRCYFWSAALRGSRGGRYRIEIRKGFDPVLLDGVVRAVLVKQKQLKQKE